MPITPQELTRQTFKTAPTLERVDPVRELVRHGIKLTFREDITNRVARYANGDYAIRLPVTITAIDPPSISVPYLSGVRVVNGAQKNPSPLQWDNSVAGGKMRQGFDSEINLGGGNVYVPALNVGYGVGSLGNTLLIDEPQSLVCTVSHPTAGNRPGIDRAVVFTFVETLPTDGAYFRPPYCTRDDKVATFTEAMIDYSVLRSLSKSATNKGPQSVTEKLQTFTRYFEPVWLDHVPTWIGREFHPRYNMPDYGAYLCDLLGQAQCIVNMDFTNGQKRDLVVNLIQIGLDMAGCLAENYSGEGSGVQMWLIGGGHASGRFLPPVMAGYLLNDSRLKNTIQIYDSEDYNELRGQTFMLADNGEGGDGDPGTTPNVWNEKFGRYNTGVNPTPDGGGAVAEWGNQHARAPSPSTGPVADPTNAAGRAQDDARKKQSHDFPDGTPGVPNKHLAYRLADTANSWWGEAAAALVMDELNGGATGCDIISKIGWDPFFKYMERYNDWVLNDTLFSASITEPLWESMAFPAYVVQRQNYYQLPRQFWFTHAKGALLVAP